MASKSKFGPVLTLPVNIREIWGAVGERIINEYE